MDQEQKSKYSIEKLNKWYKEDDEVDRDHFAKLRGNVLLVSGKHYHTKSYEFFDRAVRETQYLDSKTKPRVTDNHVQRVSQAKIRSLLSLAPGVRVSAKNPNELQDQKSAELYQGVWGDWKNSVDFSQRIVEFAKDFIDLGEVVCELIYDPTAGKFLGWEGLKNPDPMAGGGWVTDETGKVVADISKPFFLGKILANRVFGYNLLRPASTESMLTSLRLTVRSMVPVSLLKKKIIREGGKTDPRLNSVKESAEHTYTIFDGEDYRSGKGMVMLRKTYIRPSFEEPEGYFVFFTESGILWEGVLPDGIFPVIVRGYKEVQGSARFNSCIEDVRPNQIEINRCKSSIVYHQVVLGDDKVFQPSGSTLTSKLEPGIRKYSYTGKAPDFHQGRDGGQFLETLKFNIDEIYRLSDIDEDAAEKMINGAQPYALLFRSAREKEKFALYSQTFESFLKELCEKVLKLAKYSYSDEQVLRAIGKSEQDNIVEFRTRQDTSFSIIVEPASDDATTLIGRMMGTDHIIQYSPDMDEDAKMALICNYPYGNNEQVLAHIPAYQNKKIIEDLILALDRGEYPQAYKGHPHEKIITALMARIGSQAFKHLPPNVQINYQKKLAEHEQFSAMQLEELRLVKLGEVPTDGPLVKVQLYVQDPANPAKNSLMVLPTALAQWSYAYWMNKQQKQAALSNVPPGALADIARMGMPDQASPAPNQGGNGQWDSGQTPMPQQMPMQAA